MRDRLLGIAVAGILALCQAIGHAQFRVVSPIIQPQNDWSHKGLPADLIPIPEEDIPPEASTWYSIQNWPDSPPNPSNWLAEQYPGLPIYFSPSYGALFIDDTGIDPEINQAAGSLLRMAAQAAGLPAFPDLGDGGGDDGGGGVTNGPPVNPYTTNDFYLELAGYDPVASSASLLIHHPDLNQPFDIFFAPTLPLTNSGGWYWLARTLPGETNLCLETLGYASGFFVCGTTNGLDENGLTAAYRTFVGDASTLNDDFDQDGLPDNWEITQFGNLNYGPGTSTTVDFRVNLGNQHFNTCQVNGQFDILGGVPAYAAILVNNTNLDGATWTRYDGTASFTLGPTDGACQVTFGLKGRAPGATPTWIGTLVVLDRVAPSVAITCPAATNTSKPFIQVQGYSLEPLQAVTCSLSNAYGAQINLAGLLTGAGSGPTNCFALLDVGPLTNGLNVLSLTLQDLAGNLTLTNLSYFVDFDSASPPQLQLYWPQNGTQVGTDTFTLRGSLDDETALVTAWIVGSDGTTNTGGGLVERSGRVWVEDLPLSAGTNFLTLCAINAAGQSSVTNLCVIRRDLTLVVNDPPPDQLNQPTVTVSGTCDDDDYKIWVNGVATTPFGGAWSVENVPITPGGVAIFAVAAIPLSDNGGNGTSASAGGQCDPAAWNPSSPYASTASSQPDKFQAPRLVHGEWHKYVMDGSVYGGYEYYQADWNWDQTTGGYAQKTHLYFNDSGEDGLRYWIDTNGVERFEQWQNSPDNIVNTNAVNLGQWFGSGWTINGPWANGYLVTTLSGSYDYLKVSTIATNVKILMPTGGKALPQRRSLFVFTNSASELTSNGQRDIPKTSITIPGIGTPGADGRLYALLPDGEQLDVTPTAPGAYYTFTEDATKYRLVILANGSPLADNRVVPWANYCVGQYVGFAATWMPDVPPGLTSQTVQWGFDGTFVNDSWQLSRWVDAGPPIGGHWEFYGSLNYTNNPNQLTNAITQAWWVSGSTNMPGTQYNATLAESLTFANGRQIAVSQTGLLNMYTPRLMSWGTDDEAIVTNYIDHDGVIEMIRVGTPDGNHGMGLHTYVSSSYAGVACFTQVYDDQSFPASLGSNVLDGAEIYPHPGSVSVSANAPAAKEVFLTDAPNEGSSTGGTFVSLVVQFRDLARFRPDAGDSSQNIYITLGQAQWNVNGSATKIAGVWLLNPASTVTTPTWGPSADFPYWETVGPGH